MSRVVAIGEAARLEGLVLAGVIIKVASEPQAVREAWDGLGDDVGLAVLTSTASEALDESQRARRTGLTVVMPA